MELDAVRELKIACLEVIFGLHEPKATLDTMLEPLLTLARTRVENEIPVVFWRQWGRTPGRQLRRTIAEGSDRHYEEARTTETQGKHVIFVDGGDAVTTDHLFYGINPARAAGALSIGVVTYRRQFIASEISELTEAIDWMLISDDISDQPLLKENPKVSSFPFVLTRREPDAYTGGYVPLLYIKPKD